MESILVVEDEDALRDLVCSVLEESGYIVQTAGDGQEALSVYTRYKESIEAVMLDLDLPKMSGNDLLSKIQQINPDVKVIITSGCSPAGCTSDSGRTSANVFLPKPYAVDDILTTVRDALVEKTGT
jgi:DNA-binding NtrC family response regulator